NEPLQEAIYSIAIVIYTSVIVLCCHLSFFCENIVKTNKGIKKLQFRETFIHFYGMPLKSTSIIISFPHNKVIRS
ncbi:MAG: hypothetical protein LBR17_03840, partial [Bacteroidales bacterium]|nr:hypothetical protein [Bacteroidales bacterium]